MAAGACLAAPPVLTLPISVSGAANSPLSWQIPATNSPTFYTASGLPPGLVLNRQTGLISGTPKAVGSFLATIAAGNADGTSFVPSGGGNRQTTVFSIGAGTAQPGPAPLIAAGEWATYTELELGQPFEREVSATRTDATTRHVLLGELPPGVALEGAVIRGTPTRSGLFIAEIVVTNLHGFARLPVALFVPSAGDGPAPVLAEPAARTLDPYVLMEQFLEANGPVSEYVCGPLPRGLFLDPANGRLYGRPAEPGTYSLHASARDHDGEWARPVAMTLDVRDIPAFPIYPGFNPTTIERGVAVSSISLPTSVTIASRSVSELPPGMTFSAPSTLAGTPTEAGFFTPLVTFTGANGSVSRNLALVVMNPAFEKPSTSSTAGWLSIAYGAGRFVRVGSGGLIETSADRGATWSAAASGTTTTLNKIAYGGGRFVAAGSGVVVSSSDGLTWSGPVTLPASGTPVSVASSESGIIVLTSTGRVSASADGQTWSNATAPSSLGTLAGVAFYQGAYALYGAASTTSISVSADGVSWTGPVTLPGNIHVDLGVGRAGDQYLRFSPVIPLQSSGNGATWVSRGTTSDFTSITDLAHGDGHTLFLARRSSTSLLLRNPGAWASDIADPGSLNAVRGQPFQLQLTASENPLRFHAHDLPPGLSLDPATGLVSGIPLSPGSYYAIVASENALGPGRARALLIRVENETNPPPFVAGASNVSGEVGRPFDYDPAALTASSSDIIASPLVSYHTAGLPPGVTCDPLTGRLSGTPSSAGVFTIDYLISGQFDEVRHRVVARIADDQVSTTGAVSASPASSGMWYSEGKYAMDLGSGSVMFSDDGRTWGAPVVLPGGDGAILGFAAGAGRYLLADSGAVYTSSDLVSWTKRQPPAPAGGYNRPIFAAGRFVLPRADAASPAILSSPDGETWTETPLILPYPASPQSVAHGNGVFVATTTYGGPVLVSSDGESWLATNASPAVDGPVAFANGRFAVMTGGGASSTNGLSWQLEPFTAESPRNPLALRPFSQGFLVVCQNGELHGSIDGRAWRKLLTHPAGLSMQSLAAGPDGAHLRYRNGYDVFVDHLAGRWIFPDGGPARFTVLAGASFQKTFVAINGASGLAWRAAGLPPGLTIDQNGVVGGVINEPGSHLAQIWAEDADGLYIPLEVRFEARASSGAAPSLDGLPSLPDATLAAAYSTVVRLRSSGLDASTTMSGLPAGLSYDPTTLTISGKPLVAGSFDIRLSASDSYGETEWTLPLRVRNGNLTAVASLRPHGYASDGVRYVGVSGGSWSESPSTGGAIDISTDGVAWTRVLQHTYDVPLSALYGVVWADGRFVAVGSAGTVLSSADGSQWQRASLGATVHLRALAYAAGRWVAVGSSGVAAVSTDAETWQIADTGVADTLNSIVHDGSAFFAFGYNGAIRRSVDGTNWTTVNSGTTGTLYAAARGAGRFVVGATNRNILVSADGVAWTSRALGYPSNSSSATRSVAYKAGYGFVLNFYDNSTGNNRLLRSLDGLTWTPMAGYDGNAQGVFVSDELILVSSGDSDIRVFPAYPAPEITAASSVVACPGVAFHYDVAPWGLQPPLSASGLPAGLTLDPTTGLITGVVSAQGFHQVSVASSGPNPARHIFKLSVLAGPPTPLAASDNRFTLRIVRGQTVDWTVPVLHPAESWRLSLGTPKLPAGLTLDLQTGRLAGTVDESGSFLHQFYATNALGESFITLNIEVANPGAVIDLHPADQALPAGSAATFRVETGATARFQWYFNGRPLAESATTSGVRSPVLRLTDVGPADAGAYDVVVSDDLRSELSRAAALVVTSAPARYSDWLDQNTGALGGGGPLDAPFGDGVGNLLRYALGLPLAPVSPSDYLRTDTTDNVLVLTYTRPADRSDILYTVEGSRTLAGWSDAEIVHRRVDSGAYPEWQTWEAAYPLVPQARGFLRLKVTLAEP